MSTPEEMAEALLDRVLATPYSGLRKVVAIVGPPASGKSTLSKVLAEQLSDKGCASTVVPMDGFHLDNKVLSSLGLLARKGAPETFDADGMLRLVKALPSAEKLFYPTFNRDEDFARAGAGMIDSACECVIVEGNYLLLDAPKWRAMHPYWDVSVRLHMSLEILQRRLVQRWLDFGLSPDQAERRAMENDIPNARLLEERMLPASITI
jgi:fructokinase